MIILLNETKTFNKTLTIQKVENSNYNSKTIWLFNYFRQLNINQLIEFYNCSDKMAKDIYTFYQDLNYYLVQDYYNGLTFKYLDLKSLRNLDYAREKLIIISAMYGYLKLDNVIQKYRLDLNNNLDLVNYWSTKIKESLQAKIIINLCSNEYSRLLIGLNNAYKVEFYQKINDKLLTRATENKMMRGIFARWIIENQISELKELKNFNLNGYYFQKLTDQKIIFMKER